MEFEGLAIDSPADVTQHILDRTTTNPRDERPIEWVVRFHHAHPEQHDLIQQGLLEAAKALSGELPRLHEVLVVAHRTNCDALLDWLFEVTGAEDPNPERARFLLNGILGFRPYELTDEQVTTVRDLGGHPDCFNASVDILTNVDPRLATDFVVDNLGLAWRQSTDRGYLLDALAHQFVRPKFEDHRERWAAQILALESDAVSGFRAAVERQAYEDELPELLGLLDGAADGDEAGAGDAPPDPRIAKTVFNFQTAVLAGNLEEARSLAVSPELMAEAGLGPMAEQWANAIHDRLPDYVDRHAAPGGRVTSVGEPSVMYPEQSTRDAAIYQVPVEFQTDDGPSRTSLMVYVVEGNYRIGLAVPVEADE